MARRTRVARCAGVAALLLPLVACGGDAGVSANALEPSVPRKLADFELVDQRGEPRALKDWAGHPFALAMTFTSCSGPCPEITGAMRRLQQQLPPASSIRLVSLTVDPGTDTPAVLAGYAQACGADPSRWSFLTGEERAIHAFIRDSLALAVDGRRADVAEAFEPTHSSRIVAVDKQGRVRGYYDARDEVGWRALRDRLLELEREAP